MQQATDLCLHYINTKTNEESKVALFPYISHLWVVLRNDELHNINVKWHEIFVDLAQFV
jgi:hypothetical protein